MCRVSAFYDRFLQPGIIMKITKKQLRRIIREEMAHQRHGLGKNIAGVEFPIVVSYKGGSEIAYDQNELDDILDMITAGPGSRANIPYSLDSLADMEPETVPAGRGIERYAEGKRKLREYSDYASWADLHDTIEDEMSVLEDMQEKYVFSGWLRKNDRFDIDNLLRKAMLTLDEVQSAIEDEVSKNRITR